MQSILADESRVTTMLQIVDAKGNFQGIPDGFPLDLDLGGQVLAYEHMLRVRRADAEATRLQRQGLLSLWPPVFGQEAAQVGSALAMTEADFAFPQGREFGVGMTLGVPIRAMLSVWDGQRQGGAWDVEQYRLALYTFPIGSQAPHAIGYAMGLVRDHQPGAVIAYVGDGAFGTGDLHESFVWASVFNLPIVFFCQNNQYAISLPVDRQSKSALYERASGFGFPGIQVDGNDVLACYVSTKASLERAREGGGPTLIEAYTYRMGAHTTSDDPTRYRTAEEEASWATRDPLARYATYLRERGLVTEEELDAIEEKGSEAAREVRGSCENKLAVDPTELFESVHATMPSHIAAERTAWEAFLDESEPV